MARYTGPRAKKARALGEPIFGPSKAFERKKYPPGQHGNSKRRKQHSDYSLQLKEKQKFFVLNNARQVAQFISDLPL